MYQCPACGGRLKFDIEAQQLKCDYCSMLFNPESVSDGPSATEKTLYDVTVFTCPQCGGEIYSTDETAAGFCSFCGASTVLDSRLSQEERPVQILPFRRTKEDCKKAYSKAMRFAFFAPKELKDKSYIDGFRGIYMPYWVYHFTHQGPVSIPGTKQHREGDYIITDHYNLSGNLNASYDGLSYDASSAFADNISERIAPYDINDVEEFSPAYMSGFYADVSDVNSKTYAKEMALLAAEESYSRIRTEKEFRSYHIGAADDRLLGRLNSKRESVRLTMFPVWFLSYRKNDRVAYATVNGQTGKVVLDMPVDVKKFTFGSLLLAIPIFILLNLFFTLRPTVTLGISMILSLITLILYLMEMDAIKDRETYADDLGAQARMKIRPSTIKKNNGLMAGNIISLILSAIILITHPVSDLFYYGGVILSLGVEFFFMLDLIKKYNFLATRPLPQFNHQGGDDRA